MTYDIVTYAEVARWLPREIVNDIEDALGWRTEHGTVGGYQRERRRGGIPCSRCHQAARLAYRAGRYDGND